VDAETVMRIAEEFTEELLHGDFLYTVAVHNDKDHLHAHIIFDSVSQKDGYKFHSPAKDWEKRIQPITDRLCEKYNLPTLSYEEEKERKGKNYREWKHEQDLRNGKTDEITPYDIIRDDIDEAIAHSDTYPEFLDYMRTKLHYLITRNKSGLSLHPHWRGKAVRTGRLGPGYTKADICRRIINKKYEPEIETHYRQYGDMKEIRTVLLYKSRQNGHFRMTPFQRQFVQRYYRAIHIRSPVYDQTWRYQGDILKAKKISRCIVQMLRYDIKNLDDVQKRKKEITDTKHAAELKLKSLQTRLYRGGSIKYVSKYQKLQSEYVKAPSDDTKDRMEKLMEQITAVMPYEEALSQYDSICSEIKKLRDAIRSCRADLRSMEAIQTLFYEPEHAEKTMVSAYIKDQKSKVADSTQGKGKRRNDQSH
jgi:hypothetical protein